MSGYSFHPDAAADLEEIWEFIAQDSIDAADRVLAEIHEVLHTLASSPRIGHWRPDLTSQPLRFHVASDQYLIAYAPDETPILDHRRPRRASQPTATRSYSSGTTVKEIFPGVSIDGNVRFGNPCLSGTRIDAARVVGLIASGETIDTVSREYQLSIEQVRAALSYAAHVLESRHP